MKRPKKRALRVRVDAQADYAKLLSAISRWTEGQPLQPAEEHLVRSICQDVAKGSDPTLRFFEAVEGQPGSYEQVVIAVDYLTTPRRSQGKVVRRGKEVGKRWKLSDGRVRAIADEHKTAANELITSMGMESSRAFVEQMLALKNARLLAE